MMANAMLLTVLATLLSGVLCISQDYRLNDVIEPDMIRNTYLRVEKSLWENIVNDKSKSKSDRLTAIFTDHNNFVNKFMKNQLDIDNIKMLINMNSWLTLQSDVINVHRMFVSFQQHLSRESKYVEKGEFNEEVSIDLIENVLDKSNWPLIETIENLHKVVTKSSLYAADISNLKKTSCELQRSQQQLLYQVYSSVTIVQLQAFMMIQCSYMLLNVYQRGDYTNSASLLRKVYQKKIVDSLAAAHEIFERADRGLWRCDPDSFQEDKNYVQITRLLQGHIENEKDLNRERTCVDTCQNYQFTDSDFGCSERSACNRQTKCQGKLLFCRTVEDEMWICPGSKNSSRRYEYIDYNSGRTWGEKKPCTTNGFSAEYYWLYNVLWHCDHCFCICDEQGRKSDRFFSLRPSVSDTKNNMVVTGVRFVKQNRIIHLQVQESQLLEYGDVNSTSTRWVPIPQFTILDRGIKDGIDYHTLSFDRREIDLDDITAPVGHVVTGVKLRRLGNHLNLEVRVSEINFSAGKIIEHGNSFWVSNDNTEVSVGKDRRSELYLTWPHIPTKTRSSSVLKSSSNTFIKFTYSDIGKDAAQSTVPFLDSQDASTTPAMPLQGVGLILKGQDGFGGFITPKIETLDFSSYIKANQQNFKSIDL